MKRIALTDGSGRWFDAEKAEFFKEYSYHDGRNWISSATGSQWIHEAIYVTKGGLFILNRWTNYQGSRETYEEITKAQAADWFAKQEFCDDCMPEELLEDVENLEMI